MDIIVQARGLRRVFEGVRPVEALKPTDLAVCKGDYIAVSGRSGSGKSTLLHLLGLLDRPTDGSCLIWGIDTAGLSDDDRTRLRGDVIGFVFQAFHLLQYRTVRDNVALGLLYRHVPSVQRTARIDGALSAVGLSGRGADRPTGLSGGERQRVAIARAVVSEPAVLLADEPTGNLDSETAASVLDVFDDLHRAGLTIIVASHDPAVAGRADRHLRVDDGQVTEWCDTSDARRPW